MYYICSSFAIDHPLFLLQLFKTDLELHGMRKSADFGSAINFVLRTDQAEAALRILGAQDHAFAQHPGELCRLEIRDDQNFLSDHLLRRIPLLDAGKDLAGLAPDLYLAAQELP